MLHSAGVPKCECGGVIKPDVVLYEEGLDNRVVWDAIRTIAEAEVMIIRVAHLSQYIRPPVCWIISGEEHWY